MNFPFLCNNNPAAPLYNSILTIAIPIMFHLTQEKSQLLNLMLVAKLKSFLQPFYRHHHYLVYLILNICVCYRLPQKCFNCHIQKCMLLFSFLSSPTYHLTLTIISTLEYDQWSKNCWLFWRTLNSSLVFVGIYVAQSLVINVLLCRQLFVFLLFFLPWWFSVFILL